MAKISLVLIVVLVVSLISAFSRDDGLKKDLIPFTSSGFKNLT